MVATTIRWLLNISVSGELNFKLYIILINLHLIGTMGLVTILLASIILDHGLFHPWCFRPDKSGVGIDASPA